MKISLYVQVSDLIPIKKTLFEKLNNFFIKDAKHTMFKAQSAEHILNSLKKSGVNGLELIFPLNFSNENIQKVRAITEKCGMQIFSIHQSNDSFYKIGLAEIEELCKIANSFSTDIIVLHIDALGKKIFDNNFAEKLKKLQRKYQVKFAIENMPKSILTLNKNYTHEGQKFSSLIGALGLSITLDTTHLAQANGDICDFYFKNKKNIVNIHLSDYKKLRLNKKLLLANGTHLSLGEGELPIAKFLKLLRKTSYQGIITMEINSDLKRLCASAQMIRKTAGE